MRAGQSSAVLWVGRTPQPEVLASTVAFRQTHGEGGHRVGCWWHGQEGEAAGSVVAAGPTSQPDDHAGLTSARIAIPLGLALIAGAFVTLGIQGDLLPRLMRNSPTLVFAAFTLGVLGVVVPLFALLLTGRLRKAGFALGASLLLVGTGVAIWAAVSGTGIREQPTVTIVAKAKTTASTTPKTPSPTSTQTSATVTSATPTPSSQSSTTVQITASALSLASRDRMLLRVVGYPATTNLGNAERNCLDTRRVDVDSEAGGTVLFSGETGPTVTGAGTSSVTLSVSQNSYRHLCAVAVLSAKSNEGSSEATRVIVDLRNLEPLPPAD